MKKILFIGNSHLAALKLGYDRYIDEFSTVKFSFFGAADAFMKLRANENGELEGADDGVRRRLVELWGTDRVRPASYDMVFLVGLGTALHKMKHLYKKFRSDAHANREGEFQLLSDEAFQAGLEDYVRGSLAAEITAALRSMGDVPIGLIRTPEPSEAGRERFSHLSQAEVCGDGELLEHSLDRAITNVIKPAVVVYQPVVTRAGTLFTKNEYSSGSARILGGSYAEKDVNHMNADYGALVLRQVAQVSADGSS